MPAALQTLDGTFKYLLLLKNVSHVSDGFSLHSLGYDAGPLLGAEPHAVRLLSFLEGDDKLVIWL